MALELGCGGASLAQALECDDIHALMHLVAHTDVIGLLPHTIIAQSAPRLRRLQLAGAADMHTHVLAIWLKGRTLAPATERSVDPPSAPEATARPCRQPCRA
ncbi:MAG: LysR substrate-binding domain-containing protein [Pseudomonadota bacterium]